MKDIIMKEIELLKEIETPEIPTGHIFYFYLKEMNSKISLKEKMHLLWVFNMCEKSLKEARKGNRSYSRFYLDEVDNSSFLATAFLINFKNVVFLPAKAFYEYNCTGNLGSAISILQNSIQCIEEVVNTSNYGLVIAGIEQYLNICRVLYKKGNKEEAFQEFGNLLYFIISGVSNTKYWDWKNENIISIHKSSQINRVLNFATDVAINKLRMEIGEVNILKSFDILFSQFYNDLSPRQGSLWKIYSESLLYIRSSLQKERNTGGLECGINILPNIHALPNTLQHLFLTQLNKMYSEKFGNDKELNLCIEKYFVEILEIETLKVDHSGRLINTTSELANTG
jgi:hypothetical protein